MIRPIRDKVLIRRDDPPSQTASGLFIPESAQDWRSTEATVLAIGPKVHTVKVGDRVKLAPLGGVEIRDAGVLVALMPEDEILAVLPQVTAA